MTDNSDVLLRRRVLAVDDALRDARTAVGRAVRGLVAELARRGVEVTESVSYEDGAAVVASDAGLCAVLVDWDLVNGAAEVPGGPASRLMGTIRARNATLPIFLLAKGGERTITVEAMEHADELVWVLQDTAEFITGRVVAAMDRYVSGLLPPFFKALLEYNREQEYAWAVPGHQGGVAYLKTPVGRMFHDFYGENLFRTDMGIERVSLGSLLDHTGPVGESEAYAARVFGAHRSYSGLVGTSARFHPLYAGRFAMRGGPADHPGNGPTVFSTQSSHKLLAALSQASFIHVREGRRKVPHAAFNEAYMMHATTSPLYALIAANDVATSMIDRPGGRALIQETIHEAVAFRQSLARAHRQFADREEWFFHPWNPPGVSDPAVGGRGTLLDAPASPVTSDHNSLVLNTGAG